MKLVNRSIVFLTLSISFLILFSGCSKNNSFLSEEKLKEKIQGSWNLVPLLSLDGPEEWIFAADGKLTCINILNGQLLFSGTYKVKARVMNSQLIIDGFDVDVYNNTWLIVHVDDERLLMNANYKDCGDKSHCGNYEREFTRNP